MLPKLFVSRPIAHRAYHDTAHGRAENSLTAVRYAVEHGYGIEIDLQLSSDGVPMVFHDYDLRRMTDQQGAVAQRHSDQLTQIALRGDSTPIPTLADVLATVAGRVPVLIELKDQDGALGATIGPMGRAVAAVLEPYKGPAAVMSFNPHMIAEMAELLPQVPRGLTTGSFSRSDWPTVPEATLARLADIPDYGTVGASFISHYHRELDHPRVAELNEQHGAAILCWTIRSPEEALAARQHADNITFEGYAA
ncbi:Glycerophosphoryl diester phosphodiesterase [Loktanella fryxellensis]|uniref:Glycerophosphoryl diester phosphodiesterase n=1 Tax=Loktanella fryxellensis TaxID=245187 RepID=A0A1H8FLK1_9RHOB|nr:glycerophosphodiester phosphodiesterase family protein [Loktanella fryxellensis]SEN32536.1 Glycerophosphoryl diester phosphodiesterase [Loktanella fryxellensis]